MALLNKKWWANDSELAADIHITLREKEKKLPKYYHHSPQIQCRRFVVDWLALLCNHYSICDTARHLGITLLDYFMEKYDIQFNTIGLIALTALSLACKFEEHEENIPHLQDLCSHLDKDMLATPNLIMDMELRMMLFFNYDLGFPTNAHFIDYYLTKGISEGDMHTGQLITALAQAEESLRIYTNYFQEISLQSEYYRQFKPSEVTAACIAGSRQCMSIAPVWTADLHNITGYTLGKLKPILKAMLRTHDMDYKATEKEKSGNIYQNEGLPLLKIMDSWEVLETNRNQMELCDEENILTEYTDPSFAHTKTDTHGNYCEDHASISAKTDSCEHFQMAPNEPFFYGSIEGSLEEGETSADISNGHCSGFCSNSSTDEGQRVKKTQARYSEILPDVSVGYATMCTRTKAISKIQKTFTQAPPGNNKEKSPPPTTPDSGYHESPDNSISMS